MNCPVELWKLGDGGREEGIYWTICVLWWKWGEISHDQINYLLGIPVRVQELWAWIFTYKSYSPQTDIQHSMLILVLWPWIQKIVLNPETSNIWLGVLICTMYIMFYISCIPAVILFGEPNQWDSKLQLLVDVLVSNGMPSQAPKEFPSTHLPILACNMDLFWMAEASMPRYINCTCIKNVYIHWVYIDKYGRYQSDRSCRQKCTWSDSFLSVYG